MFYIDDITSYRIVNSATYKRQPQLQHQYASK